MLCLCLYVPVSNSFPTECEYFESKSLPAELNPLFKLSLVLPSQEFNTYRKWRQVNSFKGHVCKLCFPCIFFLHSRFVFVDFLVVCWGLGFDIKQTF